VFVPAVVAFYVMPEQRAIQVFHVYLMLAGLYLPRPTAQSLIEGFRLDHVSV